MKSLFIALAAAFALSAALPSSAGAQSMAVVVHYLPDIHVSQCFVIQPKILSKNAAGTQIVYTNVGTKTYSTITFAVGYRNSASNFLRRVVDHGTFGPGAKINHRFALYNDVTYGGKATTSCGAISATH
jgi:hypothetical protein